MVARSSARRTKSRRRDRNHQASRKPALWNSFLPAVALAAIVAVTYLPTLNAGFIWDDGENVLTNETLRTWDGLRQMWFVPQSIQQYYPLMYSTYWVEFHLWGINPLGYHIINVILHATASILLWRLLLRLCVPGGWLAAAIFAVHPVCVESVAWVTERKNVLSLSLALGSLLCYLRFAPSETEESVAGQMPEPSVGHWRWYVAAFILYAMALFAKTVVVSLPAVILVIYWWKRGRIESREIIRLLPFFVLGIALCLVTMWMETHHVGAQGEDWSRTPVERLLLAGRALWFYAGKLVWPHPLIFLYPRWQIDAHVWWQYLFPVTAVALPIALWCARHRIGRGPLAAVLVFGGVLTPALGFFNIFFTRYADVADHFQYHAAVALIALAAAGCAVVSHTIRADMRGLMNVVVAAVLIALAVLSFRQICIYHDLPTLLTDIIERNPQNWMPYANLADYRDEQGHYDEAADLLATSIRICEEEGGDGTRLFEIRRKRGFVFLEAGKPVEAEQAFEVVLAVRPADPRALYGQGMALATQGRWSDAQARFAKAVDVDANYAEGYYGLALAQARRGRPAEALTNFQASLRLDSQRPEVHCEFANLLGTSGNLTAAADEYRAALRLQPEHQDSLRNLGIVLLEMGQPDDALGFLRRAVQLNPGDSEAQSAFEKAEQKRQHR
ncbi:MAG TPA: tetratricopeptide repeat protein [Pirellulales bacterium]|jgi:tetratricopeptide (TPR) repeat protein